MKKNNPEKNLSFPALCIRPGLWAETIRPADLRDLRLDKIATLRAAIAAGTYKVSASDLADKLLTHMREDA